MNRWESRKSARRFALDGFATEVVSSRLLPTSQRISHLVPLSPGPCGMDQSQACTGVPLSFADLGIPNCHKFYASVWWIQPLP